MNRYRRYFLAALSGLALAACGGGDNGPSGSADNLVDMALGPADAPAVLVEYASATCGVCATYYDTMHETIEQLTEEGKLRFVFREFPRNQIDVAAFSIARCAGEDKYFDVIGDLFKNQKGIIAAAGTGTVTNAFEAIAARHGMDSEQFTACLANEDVRKIIADISEFGTAQGVTGTPTLFFNSFELESFEGRDPDNLIALVEAEQ